MVKKERRTRPTSGEGAANALDRWDEEGGVPAEQWRLPYETGDLLHLERPSSGMRWRRPSQRME